MESQVKTQNETEDLGWWVGPEECAKWDFPANSHFPVKKEAKTAQ